MNYDPSNWYWIVAGDQSRAYSSASGDYVPVSDAIYQAWLTAGNAPTSIASEAELGDVLAAYSLRPIAAGVLGGYQDSQAGALAVQIVAKALFNHENRLRALEGRQSVTAAQFRTALKGLM